MASDGMAHPYGIEFHGPVAVEPVFYPLIDGKRIPHVTLHPVRDDPEGDWALELDGRWLIVGTDSEIRKWLAFLANAMAVSAGYVCFGSDKRINPHNGPEHIGLSNGAYQALREE